MSSESTGATRPLRINTSNEVFDKPAKISVELTAPSPSEVRYLAPPALHVSTSLHDETFSTSPAGTPKPNINIRARNESRKLLAHILEQLQKRPRPPSVFDAFGSQGDKLDETGFGDIMETVKGVVRLKRRLNSKNALISSSGDDDEDGEETNKLFSTDVTCDLMAQLKDVMMISVTQGWQIFHDDSSSLERRQLSPRKSVSPFRRSRSGLQPGGRRSRSPSPVGNNAVEASQLLSQCLQVLASVISEDCRFKVAHPRPSRPPNTLQALTLDVAQFMLHIHRHDPKILSQIAFTLIPAFSAFPLEMHTRLLTFFEDGLMRAVLEGLRLAQGANEITLTAEPIHHSSQPYESPIVSIQVDEVQEDTGDKQDNAWRPWSIQSSSQIFIQSSNAPIQPLTIYYLSSLVPPLLAAILESVDVVPRQNGRVEVLHRFYQLLDTIVSLKPDTYLDILKVIAYHTAKARYPAVCLLLTFWPSAVGHLTISKPLPIYSYTDTLTTGQNIRRRRDHPYFHQFVPWRFVTQPNRLGNPSYECHSCCKFIQGFGLLCPFCMCTVHFDCYDYPEGSFITQYSATSDTNIQKMAMYRFSHILTSRQDCEPMVTTSQQHVFRAVNLFTLSLCCLCRKPLWGCTMQGLDCTSCHRFIHSSCLLGASNLNLPPCGTEINNSDHLTVEWSVLRQSCVDYYGHVFLTQEDFGKLSYEDISIIHSVLWTQLEIMTNGVAMGSIIVTQKGKRAAQKKGFKVDKFELHHVIQWCESYLSSLVVTPAPTTDDYFQENHLSRSEHSLMFDWPTLAYISSIIKAPHQTQKTYFASSSSNLLNVSPFDIQTEEETDTQPFEVLPLSHIRDALGFEFHVFSDAAARFLLSHLQHLGFFQQLDSKSSLSGHDPQPKQASCTFPLPLGLDQSTDVEILVSAIEACLTDLDLSVNEIGFLLLVRKFWPDGMTSGYASRRLSRSILSWIIAEDNNLAIILHDHVAKQQALPGVRSGSDLLPWPSSRISRPMHATSSNNGGDYVASRRSLLSRYAAAWLSALNGQGTGVYASVIYDFCSETAHEIDHNVDFYLASHSKNMTKKRSAEYLNRVLLFVIKLSQNSVIFNAFDDIFTRWLESCSALDLDHQAISSLPRLFAREVESSTQRFSTVLETTPAVQDNIGTATDPWRIILATATQNHKGFSHSLKWLCLYARSGVDIPVAIFMQFSSLVAHFDVPLTDTLLLVEAAMLATWLRSMGRQQLQAMFSALHSRLASQVIDYIGTRNQLSEVIRFIRHSLTTCLLLYGCERQTLLSLDMITEEEIENMPSRRKLNSRGSMVSDPIIIDAGLMSALECYIDANLDQVSCLIAKFFHMFLHETPYLEPYEVDNFILRNGTVLCSSAWQFYDIQRPDISSIRTSFLLRILVVDSQPLQTLLHNCFQHTKPLESRLVAVTRLFRIILDVISPAFNVEDRQWRSSVIDVFYYYFTAMWLDELEEIRLAVETSAQTLLPAHFEAISQCWNESLAKAPVAERVRLISFLIQLRPHFPNWKVLSWDVIIEALLEDDYDRINHDNEDGPASAHLAMYGLSSNDDVDAGSNSVDSDMAMLRVSILLLSLKMISDGIEIDIFSLLKIKLHLVQVAGFSGVSVVPAPSGEAFHVYFDEVKSIPESAYPCVEELLTVLDAYYPFNLAASAMGGPHADDNTPWPLLVGSIFVDVSLVMFSTVEDIYSLPILTLKSMLESLGIIIYKHDFESRPLRHLQSPLRHAVRRAMSIILDNTSYEIRQLALSVTRSFIKRWHSIMGPFIFDAIKCAAQLISSLNPYGQDALIIQAKSFIESTLSTFSNGLFNSICKRNLDADFFTVLKLITDANAENVTPGSESLRDALLRDTLARSVENEYTAFQTVLNNLQTYVEVVHHQGYSKDLMQYVGQHLTYLARRTSEWAADAIDPTPLLQIPSLLIRHNKAHSREMLLYTDTVLRVALNRLIVKATSLTQLLQVVSSVYRKAIKDPVSGQVQPNMMVTVIFEILADGLKLKARVHPSTLAAMLEALTHVDSPTASSLAMTHFNSFQGLVDNSLHFLQYYTWEDIYSDNDFTASVAVAKLILEVGGHDSEIVNKLTDLGAEKSSRQSLGVRAWNVLVLAALSDPSETWVSLVFAQLSIFSQVHFASLRPYLQAAHTIPESAATDINHAYIAIRLWLMLAHRKSSSDEAGNITAYRVWNELWPPFQSIINSFEGEARVGNNSTLMTLTWSSVADLFLFLRQSHSPLALESTTHLAILNRLRSLGSSESSTNSKLSRTLRAMNEPFADVSFDVLVSQTAKDIIATEKLRILEAGKEAGRAADRRAVPDRQRRDLRLPTL